MRQSKRGRLAAIIAAAAVLGVLGSGALVWTASQATFTDTVSNGTNQWTAGDVELSDNPTTIMFDNIGPFAPGASGSSCVRVTYTGNIAANVKLYGAVTTGTPNLAPYLNLTVEMDTEGTGGAACTGFDQNAPAKTTCFATNTLTNFAATHSDFSNGCGSWAATNGVYRTYRFSWQISASIPDNTHQNATASATFTWEAQNT